VETNRDPQAYFKLILKVLEADMIPMHSVTDANLGIKLFRHRLALVTEYPRPTLNHFSSLVTRDDEVAKRI
jgi:hypothetical protein